MQTLVHKHVSARRVIVPLAVTLLAAGLEFAGSRRSGSLFLAADAAHLVAHLGIFFVLLVPSGGWHDRGEDFVTIAVLILVLLIAAEITWNSLEELSLTLQAPPKPSFMLLSLLGLGANLTTATFFKGPAEQHWSFRAALAHELSDAALTIGGLVGALVIALFGFHWVDPGLSLAIGVWLDFWVLRLLARRLRLGRLAWEL